MTAPTTDWPQLEGELHRLLRLKTTPIGMKLFERVEDVQSIPKLRPPMAIHTTDQIVAQAARLGFTQRLAVLVPRPRPHLIRFGVRITSLREVSGPPLRGHGVLAPNAELRALVVPQEPELPAQAAPPAKCEASSRSSPPSWNSR